MELCDGENACDVSNYDNDKSRHQAIMMLMKICVGQPEIVLCRPLDLVGMVGGEVTLPKDANFQHCDDFGWSEWKVALIVKILCNITLV